MSLTIEESDKYLDKGLDYLEMINTLYDKDFLSLEEFNIVRNRIIDFMIDKLNQTKSN